MTVVSRDGTRIAYEQLGQGPPLVLVDGALCYRESGPLRPLAGLLSQQFTVYTYDRRGRGQSEDAAPYAVEREIEDLDALMQVAGGDVFVFGISSGAALALDAATRLPGIRKVALYEAPFIVDATRQPLPEDYLERLQEMRAAGRRADMVRMFMKTVEVPGIFIFLMRFMPAWSKLLAVAHTLPYDIAITRQNQRGKALSAEPWKTVVIPALVADGGKSPQWMRNAMGQLAAVLPNARYMTLKGQTHMVSAKVLAPALAGFFSA